jgi:NAD-reducing hydrogenase small subunit
MTNKKTLATISLAGCFGCHMSFLDIDLLVIDLIELVDFKKSPLTDIKTFSEKVDIGLIEGGVCNDENVEVLRMFRENCHTLISLGECAIMGGLPALRNNISLKDCLEEAYIHGPTIPDGKKIIPHHEDIPKILNKVYPCHEVVKIDYFIPGCPPSSEVIWRALTSFIQGETPELDYGMIKYD